MKFTPDAKYTALLPVWAQTRAAIAGKPGVIALLIGGDKNYFSVISPSYRQDTTTDSAVITQRKYEYFSRGRFLNFTGTSHDTYLGMIGEKHIEAELPTQIEGLKENADGSKCTLQDFAIEVASEVLTTARDGILVDPPTLVNATMAQAKGSLPKWIEYKAEQIVSTVVKDGVLVRVDLSETYCELVDGEYEYADQIRRLDLIDKVYTSSIYRGDEFHSSVTALVNGKPLDFIPFQFAGAENNKPTYDRPVMFDLAHQNLGHFMLDCDNRDNLHYHGQGMTNVYVDDPTQFATDNPGGMDVGAKGKNMFGVNDKVEILQISATGAISEEMSRDEQRMIMLGAQVVQDKSSSKTLGGETMEKNAAMSQLKRIAINVSAALTQCGKWSAEMMGANPDDVMIKVNDKFITESMTFQDVQVMFTMEQGGSASKAELNEVKRKAGYTDKTDEELGDDLELENDGTDEITAELQMQVDNLTEQLAAANGTQANDE